MPEYLEKTVDKFTFRVAKDRLYSSEGIWVLPLEPDAPKRVRVGLTDFMQQRSGDVAFLSAKVPGTRLAAGDDFAEMETIKVNLSLPSPVAGTIVEVNQSLELGPEVVNQDPYEKGWLAVIETSSWIEDRAGLLDPGAYFSLMQSQVEQELRKS